MLYWYSKVIIILRQIKKNAKEIVILRQRAMEPTITTLKINDIDIPIIAFHSKLLLHGIKNNDSSSIKFSGDRHQWCLNFNRGRRNPWSSNRNILMFLRNLHLVKNISMVGDSLHLQLSFEVIRPTPWFMLHKHQMAVMTNECYCSSLHSSLGLHAR